MIASSGGGARTEAAAAWVGPLSRADSLTLYSLDFVRERHPKTVEQFITFPVLGKVVVSRADDRKKLIEALRHGVEDCRLENGYNCFNPRHGIRARRGKVMVDYLICFECAQIYQYDGNGKEIGFALTTNSPRPTLDRILTAAGISLAAPFGQRQSKVR